MSAGSKDLFNLIKSLSKSEKRYFKIFSSRHSAGEENNYVKLFDAIEQQTEYSEQKLRENKDFGSHYSKIKERLYEAILKSMEVYFASDSSDTRIKKSIRHAEILYKKGLYKECSSILSKAKKNAENYEKYIYVLEILNLERRLARIMLGSGLKKILERSFSEEKQVLMKLQNIHEFEMLSGEVALIALSTVEARNTTELKSIRKLLKNPLLSDESKAFTLEAKFYFNMIHATSSEIEGIYEEHYYYRKRMVELFESSPLQINERTVGYIFTLNNFIVSCHRLLRYDLLFLKTLENMRMIPNVIGNKVTKDIKAKIFERSYTAELDMYIATAEFEKALNLIPGIQEGLVKYNEQLGKINKITLSYKTAYVFLINQKYHDSLKWLNKVLNISVKEEEEYLVRYAKILNLIVHYELGNEDFLEYSVRSTYRFLCKKKRMYQYESIILKFIVKKIPGNSKDEMIKAFRKLKEELSELLNDPFERKAFYFFDIISWLESKISDRPYSEIMKEMKGKRFKAK